MQHNEVKGIAKSISRWVWKKDSYCYQEYIDRQTRKGRNGGLKSKRKAVADSAESMKPWEALGISRAWYYRQKKKGLLPE
jgi:hypothetical protein